MESGSRTSNSFKNIIYSIGNNILILLLGFVSRSVFLYCLSVDYLGIQGLFGDILSMLSLADLGFGTAMTYSMYKPLADKDYDKLAGLTTFYKKVYNLIALTVTVVGVSLVPFLKYLVKLENELPHLTLYYLLFLANSIASYLVIYKTCVLSADQKSYIITKYNGIFQIIRTIAMIIVLLLTRNYILYLCVQVLFTYINNFYVSHVAEKQYPFIKKKVELSRDETKGIFSNIGSVFLYKISGVLITATDNTLISVIIGTAFVGFYSNYTMVVAKVSAIINTVFYSLTASLGNLIVKENEEKRYEIYKSMQSVSTILSSFSFVCVMCLIQNLIKVWLGQEFVLSYLVVIAMSVNFYFSIILLPIWVFREATGLYRETRFVMLLTAALNIVLSIVLGNSIGLAGIIFATSLSRLLTYFWYEPRLLFSKYFGRSSSVYFIEIAKNLVITGIAYIPGYLIVRAFDVNSWPELFAESFAVGIATIAVLILFYRKSEGLVIIRGKIMKKLESIRQKKINSAVSAMGKGKKRIEYIDVAKGLAIIAVVLGHALTSAENVAEIPHARLLNWISFFNVSTFFFINGFLYSEKSPEHPVKSIIKKLKAYYLPYLGFNLVFFVFNNLLVTMHFLKDDYRISGVKAYAKALASILLGKMQPLTGPMWFLRALIVMSVVYILVDCVSSRILGGRFRYYISGIVALGLMLVTAFYGLPNTFNVDAGFRYLPVFFAGVIYRRFDLNRFIGKAALAVFAATLTVSAVLANVTNVGLKFTESYPLAFLALALSVLMVLAVSQLPIMSKVGVFSFVGQHSLYIMALHFFAFKFVSLAAMAVYGFDAKVLADTPVIRNMNLNDLWTLAYVIVGLVLPTGVSILVNKVKEIFAR